MTTGNSFIRLGTILPIIVYSHCSELERTCFQTSSGYQPIINLQTDVAIVYGLNNNPATRIKSWQERGYRVHIMTGVAWGEYQDYFAEHPEDIQTDKYGNKILHHEGVYYICPSPTYVSYLSNKIQSILNEKIEAIHLEEPEFWVMAGYSESFKNLWMKYYHQPWLAPHSSSDAQWKASKLKYWLFRDAIKELFKLVKQYNKEHGRQIKCYVPMHSVINYASWSIVSPNASVALIEECDGFIAQVWTGTARTPNVYRGQVKERTFDTAFLEYGAMANLARASGKRIWLLHDPVEDDPRHTWSDYRINWEATVTASLFYHDLWRYEIMPWPLRVFTGKYPQNVPPQQQSTIPPEYAAEVMTVAHILENMNQDQIEWDCGTQGIGILISDSLMFQRGEPNPSDRYLSHFYSLSLPLLKHGIPVQPIPLELIHTPGLLNTYKLLILTYYGQKPLSEQVHYILGEWVNRGGILLIWDDDSDPYLQVQDWWNNNAITFYNTPREHLCELLGIGRHPEPDKIYKVGAGFVQWINENPASLAYEYNGGKRVREVVRKLIQLTGTLWHETSYMMLRRGPWIVAVGLEETDLSTLPIKTITGRFLSVFDPKLSTLTNISLLPRKRLLLLDLDHPSTQPPAILLAPCKVLPVEISQTHLCYRFYGRDQQQGIIAIRTALRPTAILVDGKHVNDYSYEEFSKITRIPVSISSAPKLLTILFVLPEIKNVTLEYNRLKVEWSFPFKPLTLQYSSELLGSWHDIATIYESPIFINSSMEKGFFRLKY